MKEDKDKNTATERGREFWTRFGILLGALVIIVSLFPGHTADYYKFEVGKPWSYDQLIARFDVPIHRDTVRMNQQLDSLRAVFVPYYTRHDVNVDSIVAAVNTQMTAARARTATDPALDNGNFKAFRDDIDRAIRQAYSSASKPVLAGSHESLPDEVRIREGRSARTVDTGTLTTTSDIAETAMEIGARYNMQNLVSAAKLDILLQATALHDAEYSAMMFDNASIAFIGDLGTIQTNQTIINKGQIVTPQDAINISTYVEMMRKSGTSDDRSDILVKLGQILFVGLLLGLLIVYIAIYEPKLWADTRSLAFIIGLVTLMFVLAAILSRVLILGVYLVPISIVPVLVLVYFRGRLALWAGVVTILLTSGLAALGFEYVFMQTCACAVAVLSIRNLTRRNQLFMTSVAVAVAYLVAYCAAQWMVNGSFHGMMWRMVAVLVANAALTSMAYVLMSVAERTFGFVSDVTLVELTDVNNPLLRALSDECPGTFNHVVAVANLAGEAANRIGADSLLTRAGAMYHDIGKLSNPMFFTENQHGVNPHDGLPPQKSAEIIINHVSDGLRRAERAGLPREIRDFIAQHHGAGQAKYFYFTACKADPDGHVDPAPYTYPGPNPQTRETSILMMADAVEAASRSLKEYTPKAINELVNKIIDGQIADGLHNDSPLSFHDISTIKDAFIRRLKTMYHSRIAYPDAPKA